MSDEPGPHRHGDRPLHGWSKEAPRQRTLSRRAATTSCEGACRLRARSLGRNVHAPAVILRPVRGTPDEIFYRDPKCVLARSDSRRDQVTPGTTHPALACDGDTTIGAKRRASSASTHRSRLISPPSSPLWCHFARFFADAAAPSMLWATGRARRCHSEDSRAGSGCTTGRTRALGSALRTEPFYVPEASG